MLQGAPAPQIPHSFWPLTAQHRAHRPGQRVQSDGRPSLSHAHLTISTGFSSEVSTPVFVPHGVCLPRPNTRSKGEGLACLVHSVFPASHQVPGTQYMHDTHWCLSHLAVVRIRRAHVCMASLELLAHSRDSMNVKLFSVLLCLSPALFSGQPVPPFCSAHVSSSPSEVMLMGKLGSIHPSIQQLFLEHILSTRHCARQRGNNKRVRRAQFPPSGRSLLCGRLRQRGKVSLDGTC